MAVQVWEYTSDTLNFEDEERSVELEEEVFKVDPENLGRGSWLWWFWLFFIDDPAKVKNPRQLAIMWSRKEEKSITCNDRKFGFKQNENGNVKGVVASWYFDGEDMNHNHLLDKTDLKIDSSSLETGDETSTFFRIDGNTCKVRIGDDFHFTAKPREEYGFAINSRSSDEYPLGMNYSMLRSNRLDLESEIKGKTTEGSAYFQRVFIDAPTPSWYWGIFHFENGGFLDYYKPQILGKSLTEKIAFYDGQERHQFHDVSIDIEQRDKLPSFNISTKRKNGDKKMRFTVEPYSKSSWKFKKKIAKVVPNRLTYREYPAKISELRFVDKKQRKEITLEDLGNSVGNAEYTTGFLL